MSFSADEIIYLAKGATVEPGAQPAEKAKKAKSKDWGGFGGPFGSYLMMDFDALKPLLAD